MIENKIRILLADESADLRALLHQSLQKHPSLVVCGQADNGASFVEQALAQQPDLIITDTLLPQAHYGKALALQAEGDYTQLDGLSALRKILNGLPYRPAIFLVASFCSPIMTAEASALQVDFLAVQPVNVTALVERVLQYGKHIHISPAQADLQLQILHILQELGLASHVLGHSYLREAIWMVAERPELIHGVTKELYPHIAKQHNTSPASVERAIRTALHTAWGRGEPNRWQYYFGPLDKRPSNSEFISRIAEKLRWER